MYTEKIEVVNGSLPLTLKSSEYNKKNRTASVIVVILLKLKVMLKFNLIY